MSTSRPAELLPGWYDDWLLLRRMPASAAVERPPGAGAGASRSGHVVEALREYETGCTMLAEELRVAPTDQLRVLVRHARPPVP